MGYSGDEEEDEEYDYSSADDDFVADEIPLFSDEEEENIYKISLELNQVIF